MDERAAATVRRPFRLPIDGGGRLHPGKARDRHALYRAAAALGSTTRSRLRANRSRRQEISLAPRAAKLTAQA